MSTNPGATILPRGVDFGPAARLDGADASDAVAVDRDIGDEAGLAAAVDDGAAADDEVVQAAVVHGDSPQNA